MFRLKLAICVCASVLWPVSLHGEVIDGEELVDPTRPLFVSQQTNTDDGLLDMIRTVVPASYEVTFIRAGSNSSMAVVNDQRVSVGDEVGGARVVAIDRNGVTLSINDQEQRISLFRNNVKSPVVNN